MVKISEDELNRSSGRIFLTFREAQHFLNISHQTMYKLMKDGLPSHKIARNRVFFKEDLIKWIRDH